MPTVISQMDLKDENHITIQPDQVLAEQKFRDASISTLKPDIIQTTNTKEHQQEVCPPGCGCIYKSRRKPRNTDFLDGIRAVAIFLVIAAHSGLNG